MPIPLPREPSAEPGSSLALTLRLLGRRRILELLGLCSAFAWSVAAGLGTDELLIEGGRTLPVRLDLVVAFLPQGWPTLAALLWAPFVVWRGRRHGRDAVPEAGDGALVSAGGLLLALATLGGILGGTAWAHATTPVVVGSMAAPLLLVGTMLVLYLAAATLLVATGRFWPGIVGVAVALSALRLAAMETGWPPLVGLHRGIAVGRFGPGTMLEAPGVAAGVILEPEWQGLSPWEPVVFFLTLTGAALWAAVRWRRQRTGAPGLPRTRGRPDSNLA